MVDLTCEYYAAFIILTALDRSVLPQLIMFTFQFVIGLQLLVCMGFELNSYMRFGS